MGYVTPIIILIVSNVAYNMCSKNAPESISPLAMMVVVYAIAAITSGILYHVIEASPNLLGEYHHLNWASFLMGIFVVGLEVGNIYMYKVGWQVSVGFMLSSTLVALALFVIGVLIYKEAITVTKVAGVVVCLVGLYLINK